ncbi:hypothetical protein RYX36_027991 [Vicia faba]
MIKQIIGKIPRKPSKSLERDSNGDGELVNGSCNSVLKSNLTFSKSSNSGSDGLYSGNGSSSPLSKNSNKTNQAKKLIPAIGPHAGSIMALGNGNGVYEALSSFWDVSSSEKANLLIRNLNMCCVIFDFNDTNKHLKEKDIKRQTFLELVDYVSAVNSKFSEATMQEITKMAAENLFQMLPCSSHDGKLAEA